MGRRWARARLSEAARADEANLVHIAYAGTPEFAVPALTALLGSPHSVVGVLTQPDRPKGRGRQLAASPVKQLALDHGIPVSQPQSLRDESSRADLRAWRPDALVVVAYGLILPQAVLDLPRLGCFNIHASLLPRWRGAAPIQRAVLAGDRETGITIMRMGAGLDTGPILLQHTVSISPADTAGSLHDSLSQLGARALLKALEGVEDGSLASRPQPAEGVTYAAKIAKSEAAIDWTRSAEEIARKVRAFDPSPIAETQLDGEQLRIYRVLAAPEPELPMAAAAAPGTITVNRNGSVLVACGTGALTLVEVQRPGRRPISARDWANTSDLAGRRLGQVS
jgi:methionyl-tRNA formyltransferase